jgi:hypothetical protein
VKPGKSNSGCNRSVTEHLNISNLFLLSSFPDAVWESHCCGNIVSSLKLQEREHNQIPETEFRMQFPAKTEFWQEDELIENQ